MPRLLRPYIPLEVRCRVALRQLGELFIDRAIDARRPRRDAGYMVGVVGLSGGGFGAYLDELLGRLAELLACDVKSLALDHDPALGAREKVFRKGEHVGYRPDANDPEYLIYREKHAHHIKTNVRGDGAQHPDRVLIKKNRRIERGPRPKRAPRIQSRGFEKGPKRPWGKRSFDNRRRKSP